jgi:DNA-binding PadR family transcriptional regulator
MKLTRRQETFVLNLLDLYRELNGPIHYSILAERVGVSRITAYDMLRLLEEKGFVTSDYQRGKPGPGRAEVVFWPTEMARRRLAKLIDDIEGVEASDWHEIKQRALERIQNAEMEEDYNGKELANEMFTLIPPDGPTALRYCAEVMTILILRLRDEESRQCLRTYLPNILLNGETASAAELNLLSGFILGLLAGENDTTHASNEELVDHIKLCQRMVLGMETELRGQLAIHLSDIFSSFDSDQKSRCVETLEGIPS